MSGANWALWGMFVCRLGERALSSNEYRVALLLAELSFGEGELSVKIGRQGDIGLLCNMPREEVSRALASLRSYGIISVAKDVITPKPDATYWQCKWLWGGEAERGAALSTRRELLRLARTVQVEFPALAPEPTLDEELAEISRQETLRQLGMAQRPEAASSTPSESPRGNAVLPPRANAGGPVGPAGPERPHAGSTGPETGPMGLQAGPTGPGPMRPARPRGPMSRKEEKELRAQIAKKLRADGWPEPDIARCDDVPLERLRSAFPSCEKISQVAGQEEDYSPGGVRISHRPDEDEDLGVRISHSLSEKFSQAADAEGRGGAYARAQNNDNDRLLNEAKASQWQCRAVGSLKEMVAKVVGKIGPTHERYWEVVLGNDGEIGLRSMGVALSLYTPAAAVRARCKSRYLGGIYKRQRMQLERRAEK